MKICWSTYGMAVQYRMRQVRQVRRSASDESERLSIPSSSCQFHRQARQVRRIPVGFIGSDGVNGADAYAYIAPQLTLSRHASWVCEVVSDNGTRKSPLSLVGSSGEVGKPLCVRL